MVVTVAALVVVPVGSGCATAACSKVRADRQAFAQQRGTGDVAQMVLAIPRSTLSQSLSFPLSRVAPVALPLPTLALPQLPGLGIDLGAAEMRLRSVEVLSAADGQVGLRVRLGLMSRGREVLAIDLDTVIAPQLSPQDGSVRLQLRPRDLVSVRPSLPPAERRKFVDFVVGMVPAGAARLVSRGRIEQLVDSVLGDLLGRSFPKVRDALLGRVETLVDVEIDLPAVPLTRVALRSPGDDLELWLYTSLPAGPVAAGPARAPGGDPRLVQLRMSGAAAAALTNQAIVRGEVPGRYNLAGEPSPTGEFEAGVAWSSGPRPLRIHAWKQQPTCAHITFSGTPVLQATQGNLNLAVPDARIERVRGAAKARVAVWYSGLGRQTFAFSEAMAGSTEFSLLGVRYAATPQRAAVVGDDVTVEMLLVPATGPSTGRR